MCGVAGYFGDLSIGRDGLKQMLQSIAHRGPDGEGMRFWNHSAIGLGHRRLSILDLTAQADQPMTYEASGLWLVYNGEIYNFLELQADLEKKGYRFKTKSDSEVVLASFLEWGIDAFKKWNGMWAVCIYDEKNKRLILCRDRFGVKPLYIYRHTKGIAFASELKAFRSVKNKIPQTWDGRAVRTALISSAELEATQKTLFKEVVQLPAGHCLELSDSGERLTQWWDTEEAVRQLPENKQDPVSRFKELFLDACKIRLRSDVATTTSLSGGLDSSSIVAAISLLRSLPDGEKRAQFPKTAFVHRFSEKNLDESIYADQVARHCGYKIHEVLAKEKDLVSQVDADIIHFEGIYPGMLDSAKRVYQAQKQEGYKVSLDGHGADELLGGYHHYLFASGWAFWKHPQKARDWLLQVRQQMGGYYSSRAVVMGLLRSRLDASELRYWTRFLRSALDPLTRCIIGVTQKSSVYTFEHKQFLGNADRLNSLLYNDYHFKILPRILKNFDLTSMSQGVEVRMPFMDYRLVSYAFSLPSSFKVSTEASKWILRKSMQGHLPNEVLWRKTKIGFNSPMQDWLASPLKSWLEDSVFITPSAMDEWIDRPGLIRFYNEHILKQNASWTEVARFWSFVSALRLGQLL